MQSLSRDQVRRVDRWAIDALGIPGVILMENAGRQVADAVEKLLGDLGRCTVAVVAGAGNNGGDGYVAARHLALRGASVATFLVSPPEKITGDARVNLDAIRALGHDLRALSAEEGPALADALKSFDVVVDAVGGTGIRGELCGDLAAAVKQINAAERPVVAVDIPTGLDCDTGCPSGPTVKAVVTVSFVARKLGFDNPDSVEYTGDVVVADIGVPADGAGPDG